MEGLRHALSHRIPLYVPPYTVKNDEENAAHRVLELQKAAAVKRLDFAEYDRLTREQEALGSFKPIMTHSFSERAKVVVFHAQLLADFNTIDQLGLKILEELDR